MLPCFSIIRFFSQVFCNPSDSNVRVIVAIQEALFEHFIETSGDLKFNCKAFYENALNNLSVQEEEYNFVKQKYGRVLKFTITEQIDELLDCDRGFLTDYNRVSSIICEIDKTFTVENINPKILEIYSGESSYMMRKEKEQICFVNKYKSFVNNVNVWESLNRLVKALISKLTSNLDIKIIFENSSRILKKEKTAKSLLTENDKNLDIFCGVFTSKRPIGSYEFLDKNGYTVLFGKESSLKVHFLCCQLADTLFLQNILKRHYKMASDAPISGIGLSESNCTTAQLQVLCDDFIKYIEKLNFLMNNVCYNTNPINTSRNCLNFRSHIRNPCLSLDIVCKNTFYHLINILISRFETNKNKYACDFLKWLYRTSVMNRCFINIYEKLYENNSFKKMYKKLSDDILKKVLNENRVIKNKVCQEIRLCYTSDSICRSCNMEDKLIARSFILYLLCFDSKEWIEKFYKDSIQTENIALFIELENIVKMSMNDELKNTLNNLKRNVIRFIIDYTPIKKSELHKYESITVDDKAAYYKLKDSQNTDTNKENNNTNCILIYKPENEENDHINLFTHVHYCTIRFMMDFLEIDDVEPENQYTNMFDLGETRISEYIYIYKEFSNELDLSEDLITNLEKVDKIENLGMYLVYNYKNKINLYFKELAILTFNQFIKKRQNYKGEYGDPEFINDKNSLTSFKTIQKDEEHGYSEYVLSKIDFNELNTFVEKILSEFN